MKHKKVAVILATGGAGMVKAAYSSGKPAYGVGPGNVPTYLDRSANVRKAVRDILTGKTFDNGTLCSSEQSVIVDAPVEPQVFAEFQKHRAYFLNEEEGRKLESVAILPNRSLNPQIVGKSPQWIANKARFDVPENTRALIVRLEGVGRDYPLSCEKLSPVLAYYVVKDWREGCERCKQILAYGGMGHTLSIHCEDPDVIRQFGLEKPAFRICVNTPATHGSIGLSTSLPPSMTLGCGTYGNNITTDNITPLHLIQIKRLAWETREALPSWLRSPDGENGGDVHGARRSGSPDASVSALVEEYLSSRGIRNTVAGKQEVAAESSKPAAPVIPPAPVTSPTPEPETNPGPRVPPAVEFVCEQDVRAALQTQGRIYIDAKTIITPAAWDLGAAHEVFVKV